MSTLEPFWDDYAKNHLNNFNYEMAKFIRDLALSLRMENILEVGCNAGNDLKLFPQEFGVNGIDTSEIAINQALQNLPKFNFKRANIVEIPFKDNSIDLVFTRNVFNYLEFAQIKKAVDELFRVSKKYIFNIELFLDNEEKISENPTMLGRDMKKLWMEHNVKIVSNVDMHEEIDPKKSRFTLLRKL